MRASCPAQSAKSLSAGQRAVDAGRADLEAIAAFDRVAGVESFRQSARDSFAIGEVELARVGGSAITCSVGSDVPPIIATRTRSKAKAFTSGSINLREAGYIGHSCSWESPNVSRTGAGGHRPQASSDVEERAAI